MLKMMMKVAGIGTIGMVLALSSSLSLYAADDAPEVFYVEAAKGRKLKGRPKMDAKNLADLKRGDALTVLQKQEIWYQVSFGAANDGKAEKKLQTGWISKLL